MPLRLSLGSRPGSCQLEATTQQGACRGRGRLVVYAMPHRQDPRQNPDYRRGSSNTYWRKRTDDRKSAKGQSVSEETRRRGRPAHLRSPDDTPLRDGNRDRLMGLLTDRAVRTLVHLYEETNPTLHSWLTLYVQHNGIPKDGNWSDVSGENFLRKLLTRPIEEISASFGEAGPQFANASPVGADPRAIAQRIMDIRHQIAKECIEELRRVPDDNRALISETLMTSLSMTPAVADPKLPVSHPETRIDMQPDDSAGGGDD